MPTPHPNSELRRLATQIASTLPENTGEARRVLRLATELVDNFMAAEEEPPTNPSPSARCSFL